MTKEALYPSQINTKTISCRISSLDYVNFLQDALSKGITLNDWLLMKIYANKSILGTNEQDFSIVYEFLNKEIDENETGNYNISDFVKVCKELNVNPNSPDGIVNLFYILLDKVNSDQKIYIKMFNENYNLQKEIKKSEPNLSDIKAQILTLSQSKFKDRKALKEFMFDVNELLEELG